MGDIRITQNGYVPLEQILLGHPVGQRPRIPDLQTARENMDTGKNPGTVPELFSQQQSALSPQFIELTFEI